MALPRHQLKNEPEDGSITEMSPLEAERLLDDIARASLGMTGREFVARYRAGEIEDTDRVEVIRALMLLPLLVA